MGLKEDEVRYRDHDPKELAFYSKATTDIEYNFPWGFGELWGIASRTDYDLKRHMEHSKENLEYLDSDTNTKYIPYVVEPSVGVGRLLLAILFSAYDIETLENGDTREVLRLKYHLAPYKVCVLPLIKKVHADKANEIYAQLAKEFPVTYDESAAIGKRYRRQDSIGTPFCLTVDDNTLNEGTVTLRDRDTMQQVTLKIEEVAEYVNNKIKF